MKHLREQNHYQANELATDSIDELLKMGRFGDARTVARAFDLNLDADIGSQELPHALLAGNGELAKKIVGDVAAKKIFNGKDREEQIKNAKLAVELIAKAMADDNG